MDVIPLLIVNLSKGQNVCFSFEIMRFSKAIQQLFFEVDRSLDGKSATKKTRVI